MIAMIDTNVLVYATRPVDKSASQEEVERRQDCRALILATGNVLVSVITYTEFVPFVDHSSSDANAVMAKLIQLPYTPEAAHFASALIRKHTHDSKAAMCQKCWNRLDSSPCTACSQLIPRARRLNDFYIIATAAMAPEVDVLYTHDLKTHMKKDLEGKVELRLPPSSNGPLFGKSEPRALAEASEELSEKKRDEK